MFFFIFLGSPGPLTAPLELRGGGDFQFIENFLSPEEHLFACFTSLVFLPLPTFNTCRTLKLGVFGPSTNVEGQRRINIYKYIYLYVPQQGQPRRGLPGSRNGGGGGGS